jgi:hypothetical protein
MPKVTSKPRVSQSLPKIRDIRHLRVDVRLRNAIEGGRLPKELVICGPAGTGKTYPILAVIHDLCKRYPLRVLALRATRVSLTESVLVTYEDKILAADGWRHLADGAGRAHRLSYDYPSGATIVPAGLDRNPTRVLSTEWDMVYVNECIEVKQDVWETLATRTNRPGSMGLGWLMGDTNPGSPDHWLKKRCDASHSTLWATTHEANPAMHDGRGWTPAGLSYLDTLNRLTGVRRKRLLEGLWVQGEGVWFDTFDPAVHVTEDADWDHHLPVRIAIDSGVFTGAVLFQIREHPTVQVNVFADYLTEGLSAEQNALAILKLAKERCRGRIDKAWTDPAGGARNPVGPTVMGEYERSGLRLDRWPLYGVADGLALIEAFLGGTENSPPAGLFIHPRCTNLINAFGSYKRAKRAEQWMDYPEDPQHPYEDTMDALRGGLVATFPDGRRPGPKTWVNASRVF